MAWDDPKSPAVDPDNPTADEQVTATEWNEMRLELQNRIIAKAVDASNLGDTRILVYDLASDSFVFEDQNEITELNDIPNVVISGVPADTEVLAYDNGTSKWINQTAAEAGLATATALTAYLPLAGGTMTGDLNMGDRKIDDIDDLQAYDASGIMFRDYVGNVMIRIGASDESFMAYYECDMNSHKITNVTDPTADQDVSTKKYADGHLASKVITPDYTDGYVLIYDTATGKFKMEAQSAIGAILESDFDATSFLYATADNTPLPKTPTDVMAILSGTAGAEFLLNTQQIGGVADPTTAQQAATKKYADEHITSKAVVTDYTDEYIWVYRTASGKFEMEAQSAAAGLPVADTTNIIKGSADGTKLVRFEADGLTTGTTRVMTVPDKDITLCDTAEVMLLSGTQAMTGDLHADSGKIYIDGSAPTLHLEYMSTIMASIYYNSVEGKVILEALDYGTATHIPMLISASYLDMDAKDIDDIGAVILNDATEKTIATGAITVTQSYHKIDTEADAASDPLDTINGGTAGMQLILRAENSARTVTVTHAIGNIILDAGVDFALDNVQDTISLIYDGTKWLELSRANNGA